MSTYLNSLETPNGLIHILTKSRWMFVIPKPRTSIMPHDAVNLGPFSTIIMWTTNDSATLATLHNAVVHLVQTIGINVFLQLKLDIEVIASMEKSLGRDSNAWRERILQPTGDGTIYPIPANIIKYIDSIR